MSYSDRTLINYPNTYFNLLPKELQVLLSSFYYGLIEMKIYELTTPYHRNEIYVSLNIKIFTDNNRIRNDISIYKRLDTLPDPDDKYGRTNDNGVFLLSANKLEINVTENRYYQKQSNVLYLYGNEVTSFIEKLTTIKNIITEYRKKFQEEAELLRNLRRLTV